MAGADDGAGLEAGAGVAAVGVPGADDGHRSFCLS